MEKIRPGVYRHYKGKEYDVYGEAIFSGTEGSSREIFTVIYRPRYGQRRLTCRAKAEFLQPVSVDDVSRFLFVRDFDSPYLTGIAQFFSS